MDKNVEIMKLSTPFIKLDQLLKFSGVAGTGGDAKLLIGEGYVKLNGEAEFRRGKKVFPGDEVEICCDDRIFVLKLE